MAKKAPYGTLKRHRRQDGVEIGHGISRVIGELNLEYVQQKSKLTGQTEVAICNMILNDAILKFHKTE